MLTCPIFRTVGFGRKIRAERNISCNNKTTVFITGSYSGFEAISCPSKRFRLLGLWNDKWSGIAENSIQTAFFSWISQSFLSAKKIQREFYSKIEHQKLRFVPNQNQIVKTIDDGVDRELIKKHDTEPIKYSWAEWQSPLWLFSNVNHFE